MHHHLSLRHKLIIMLSVMASLFLVALDQTIVATALGRIVEDFNAFDSLSWIVTAYLLTTTVTVPIAGKLSDLFGRRVMLLIGVAVFGAGSLMSGLAADINQLVVWRAFQGIGGGIITANAFTIIGDLFAARERGRWQGIFGAVFGLSSIIGPLLGGWLADGQQLFGLTTDWRWTFTINVPIALVAFAVIAVFCPPLRHAKKPRVDYLGAALLTIALATLVLAVDNTEAIFADVMQATGLSLVGLRMLMGLIVVGATIAFVTVQRRTPEPILPLSLFSNRTFVLLMGVATMFGTGFIGSILYLTQFNQQVFGATPTESGLMLLPMVAGIMVASIGSGQIIARTGRYKAFMQFGIVLATAMVALLATLTPESSYLYEAAVITLLGLGLGFVMPVMNIAVQNEVEQKHLGIATSSVQLFRGLGSTVGIALFGAMLTMGIATQLREIELNPYVRQLEDSSVATRIGSLNDPNTLLTLNTNDVRTQVGVEYEASAKRIPAELRPAARQEFMSNQVEYSNVVAQAFSDSLRGIFITSAALMLLASVLVFFIQERELKKARPEATPGEI